MKTADLLFANFGYVAMLVSVVYHVTLFYCTRSNRVSPATQNLAQWMVNLSVMSVRVMLLQVAGCVAVIAVCYFFGLPKTAVASAVGLGLFVTLHFALIYFSTRFNVPA